MKKPRFCRGSRAVAIPRNHPSWRGQDLNLRPRGYEPRELPDCSTPRQRLFPTQDPEGLLPGTLLHRSTEGKSRAAERDFPWERESQQVAAPPPRLLRTSRRAASNRRRGEERLKPVTTNRTESCDRGFRRGRRRGSGGRGSR